MRFYEVNPQVVALAERWFSYLSEARGETSVVVGDARVELERELKSQSQQFDLLIVDAFSSDSIPAHLLTRECQRLYWEHLRADGVLAIHISNRYLDLRSVLIDCGGVEGVAHCCLNGGEPGLMCRNAGGSCSVGLRAC